MNRSNLRAVLFGAAITMLGACGGGGGGGGGGISTPPPAPINGNCGAELNICQAGTLNNIDDSDTEYLWNCNGSNGGTTAMCSLPKPIDGECGEEVNICLAGDLDDIDDSDTDFLWDCGGQHGGAPAMCSLPKPIDGVCGEELNICLTGDLDDIDDTDTDNLWNCGGQHGGAAAMCSLPKPIDGTCGEDLNICLTGNLDDIDDTDTDNLWNCDGQHGGAAAMCSLPKSVVCPNGAPASDNPLLCKRGYPAYLIPGIDRLPLDRVQLTNEQVQKHFAIVESTPEHAITVGVTACESYVTVSEGCEQHANRAGITRHPEGDEETRTGLTPFTQILNSHHDGNIWEDEQIDAMQDLRILNLSAAPNQLYLGDADKPYLHIRSAGNSRSNYSWFLDDKYPDYARDLFTRANAANKLLFVAGADRDVNGNYIRHNSSSSCRDVDYGCFWTWYHFLDYRWDWGVLGTSHSAPNIAASLASILSIFPDTEHQDLAKLARACAKKTGEGIDGPDGLLATSGGFGVADFSCMDEITAASADLAEDETVTLTIDGREVVVSSRLITVTEPDS